MSYTEHQKQLRKELAEELQGFSNVDDIVTSIDDPVARCTFYLSQGGYAQRAKFKAHFYKEGRQRLRDQNANVANPESNYAYDAQIENAERRIHMYNLIQLRAEQEFLKYAPEVPEDSTWQPRWLDDDATVETNMRNAAFANWEDKIKAQREEAEKVAEVESSMICI